MYPVRTTSDVAQVPRLSSEARRPGEEDVVYRLRRKARQCYLDFVEHSGLSEEQERRLRRILADAQDAYARYREVWIDEIQAGEPLSPEDDLGSSSIFWEANERIAEVLTKEQAISFIKLCAGSLIVMRWPFDVPPPNVDSYYGYGRLAQSGL